MSISAKPNIYAIDFGTSNSLCAAANASRVFEPVPLDLTAEDPSILRSVFLSPDKNQWVFGQEAIDIYTERSGQARLFRSIKKFLPDENFSRTQVHSNSYSITDLIGLFLRKIRTTANTYFDTDVTSVVLGRPAAFSLDLAKDKIAQDRLEAAAKIAGFKYIEFCPEPIAAAYDFQKQLTAEKIVLVADFGAGTSDFTIVRMSPERKLELKDVLALGGLSIAGDAYDGSIMQHKISHNFGVNIRYKMPLGSNVLELPRHLILKLNSPADISFLARENVADFLKNVGRWSLESEQQKLLDQLLILAEEGLGYAVYKKIEQTKKQLSQVDLASFSFHHQAGIDIDTTVSAQEFECYSKSLTERILQTLHEVIKASQLNSQDIDLVCLTGGTSQIKGIKQELVKVFGAEKITQSGYFHSIIQGLALKAKEISA